MRGLRLVVYLCVEVIIDAHLGPCARKQEQVLGCIRKGQRQMRPTHLGSIDRAGGILRYAEFLILSEGRLRRGMQTNEAELKQYEG